MRSTRERVHGIEVKSKVAFEYSSPSICLVPWKLSVNSKGMRRPYVPTNGRHRHQLRYYGQIYDGVVVVEEQTAIGVRELVDERLQDHVLAPATAGKGTPEVDDDAPRVVAPGKVEESRDIVAAVLQHAQTDEPFGPLR